MNNFLLVLCLFSFNFISLHASEKNDSIPLQEDLFPLLFQYLTLPELYNMGLTAKDIDAKVAEYLRTSSESESLKRSFKNHIMLKDYGHKNPFMSIDDFLNSYPQRLQRVYEIVDFLRNKPDDFIKLALHSVPRDHQTSESDLNEFYKHPIQIDRLIASLPAYETPHQKLTAILIETLYWSEAWPFTRVVEHEIATTLAAALAGGCVGACTLGALLGDVYAAAGAWYAMSHFSMMSCVMYQHNIIKNVDHIVGRQILESLKEQIKNQLGHDIWGFVEKYATPLKSQLNKDLRQAGFTPGIILKTPENYKFAIYQLASLANRGSKQVEVIFQGIHEYLLDRISLEEVDVILNSLSIPLYSGENIILNTQIKLIEKHLTASG